MRRAPLSCFATIAFCFSIFSLSLSAQTPEQTFTTNPSKPAESKILCTQDSFFQTLTTEPIEEVYGLMHPALARLIDEPVLETWTEAVRDSLGEPNDIQVTNTSEKQRTDQGDTLLTIADVKFSKGKATSRLETLNGQLIAFKIDSDQLKGWFRNGPENVTLYVEEGRSFIRRFMLRESNSAFNLCHPALQKQVPHPKLAKMIMEITNSSGPMNSVEYVSKELNFTDESQKLILNYQVDCENTTVNAQITFQFVGMKGHLVAFTFN